MKRSLYGSDGTVWYVVQGPTGATLQQLAPLSHIDGGLSVLYTASDAEAAIALIEPSLAVSSGCVSNRRY